MAVECRRTQAAGTSDDGSDPGSLASAEDSAEQSAGPRTDRRVLNARAASAARFDRTLHIDFLA
jgi:hypothetical protein